MKNLMFLVLCFLLISTSAWAAGENCESNADCADNEECVFVPQMTKLDCPPCAEGEDCPPCGEEDDGGEAEALGTCLPIDGGGGGGPMPPEELLCDEDSECGLGLVCTEHTIECKGASTSPGIPTEVPTPSIPTDSPDCACECEADDEECLEECDCGDDDDGGNRKGDPEGTAPPDREQDDGEGEDNDIDCEEEVVKICGIDPTDCESDTDCMEGFECQEIEECWATAVTSCVCAEGDEECDCDEEEARQESEEGCDVVDSFCRPKLSACGEEDACPEGWVCVSLPDGAEDELGMESACLPEGWDVLVQAEVSGESMSQNEGTTSVFGNGDSAPAEPSGSVGDGGAGGPEGETKNDEAKKAASGLCSLGNGGQFGLTTFLLLMGFVGLLAVRRERHQV